MDKIKVIGARENNLKNINVEIPKNQLVIMTGVSGSGKTSLAFNTIYEEGKRRYVESLSAYARQFLGNAQKPDVDQIDGLCPSISIDQKTTSNNPRSTLGTVTEIYDYLRLLYARVGKAYCPTHNILISSQTIDQMINEIYSHEENSKVYIYSPIINDKKGSHKKLIEDFLKDGFQMALIDGENVYLEEVGELDKNKKHNISLLIDRLKLTEDNRLRLSESLEQALHKSNGLATVMVNEVELNFSERYSCPKCDFSIKELEPRLFSFNAPIGSCPECKGIGSIQKISEDLVFIPDKTLFNGGFKPWGDSVDKESLFGQELMILFDYYKVPYDTLIKDYDESFRKILYYGSDDLISFKTKSRGGQSHEKSKTFEGLVPMLERRLQETSSEWTEKWLSNYTTELECGTCHGKRLNEKALAVKVGGKNIYEFTRMNPSAAIEFLDNLELSEKEKEISNLVVKEIKERLSFLVAVGLDYLTLDRRSSTLSGGEAQRIRLATQIGSKLSGVLYVLDEPSIGLHPSDSDKLYKTLKDIRDLGNSLIVVEHDEDLMRISDYIIDIGPYAGTHGGELVAYGTPKDILKFDTVTTRFLSGKDMVPLPEAYRPLDTPVLEVVGANENNLKNVNAKFYLSRLNVVTGVSGSGKSSLVNECLYKGLMKALGRKTIPGAFKEILGAENIDRVIDIDQSPIGRTPRSNPATYTSLFDDIRDLFASTNEAKLRGYSKGRFSFNVKGGRCEACKGDGVTKISMHFLPDVYVTCDECHGKRYNRETLEVKYKGKTISDVLEMTISEALEFFQNIPSIERKLRVMEEVGIGYIKLGQSSTTLSGGEAQRVKLASELNKTISSKTLYILDEPTTGLHSYDVKKLVEILQRIVNQGATVVVIEHNLDVIKQADNLLDLGPEGGNNGGTIVISGAIKDNLDKKTHTMDYLKPLIK